jgi:TonB-linked SusC/RagA family outer membrane protein
MAPNVYDQDNLMSPNLEDVDMFGISNPLAILNNAQEISSNYGFLGNVNISWNLWKGLTLSSVFGIRYNKEREKVFFPSVGVSYEELPAAQVENEQQHRVERYFSIFSDTRANYLFKFSHDHLLNATVGMRYQKNNVEDDWGKGYNSPSDKFRSIQYGLSELRQAGGALGEWRWFSMYGNADYSFKSKYFLTATASFDNSTRYGSAIGALQPYGSLSAAWLISSEDFMVNIDDIDMLKLRVGYSTSGNDDIGNYAALRYYQPQNLMGNYGLVRGNIVNPNLRPETNATLNAGLDISLLNERLSLSADIYRSEIRNMIIYPTAKDISGFSTYISNGGAMRNIGLDLTLNARLVNTSVKWDFGATASFYKNKITKLEEGNYITQISDANILTSIGNPLGLFYGYKTNGVYATDAEAQADGLKVKRGLTDYNFHGGDVRFVNQNDDKYIDEKDMKVIGNPNPDVFGGFNTSVKWKRIKATANFLYSIGNDIYNQTRRTLESMTTFANQTEAVLNRWKVDGQVTSVPKAVYGDPMGNSRFSDRWIEDGSYLKFKNLTLSYDLPIKQGVFTGIQLYGVVDNIYTFTSYKGYDPEFSMSTSPLGYGIDSFIVPQSRTFYVGLKIGL